MSHKTTWTAKDATVWSLWGEAIELAQQIGVAEAATQTGCGRGSLRALAARFGINDLPASRDEAFSRQQTEHSYRIYHMMQHRGPYDDDIAIIKQMRVDAGERVREPL